MEIRNQLFVWKGVLIKIICMKNTSSSNRYRGYVFRTIAIVGMLYGISLIGKTAAAATLLQLY